MTTRQDVQEATLPTPLAQHDFVPPDAAAVCLSAQEEALSQVSTPVACLFPVRAAACLLSVLQSILVVF